MPNSAVGVTTRPATSDQFSLENFAINKPTQHYQVYLSQNIERIRANNRKEPYRRKINQVYRIDTCSLYRSAAERHVGGHLTSAQLHSGVGKEHLSRAPCTSARATEAAFARTMRAPHTQKYAAAARSHRLCQK